MGALNLENFSGLTCDSRHVKPGMIFAALPGTVSDGRDYIPKAIEKGAGAILSLPGLPKLSVPLIENENPRLVYAQLAARFHPGQPKTLIAMTGTNGKSSTVEFLRQIWDSAGHKAACFGTLGVRTAKGHTPLSHTTPDAVDLHKALSQLKQDGVTHVAMEASSHGLDQYRLDGVKVSAAGFSNLTQDHFDYHSNVRQYFAAKARLFTELTPPRADVVINVDDAYGRQIADICKARGQSVLSIGWQGKDIAIKAIKAKPSSQNVSLDVLGKSHKFELPLAGAFQVFNAVSALGLALVTDVKRDMGLEALENLQGVAGRMEPAGHNHKGAPIFIDFAHTEDGLDKVLTSLRPHTEGALVVVFGCGGDRDPDKRAKMGAVAQRLADRVIVTDDNPRSEDPDTIRKAVMRGCPKAQNIGGRAKAIRAGIDVLGPKDCLVVAGKGHETGQIISGVTYPFSDIEEVHKYLKEQSDGR